MTDVNPFTCSDREWHDETGMCGCGVADCHPAERCGDVWVPDPMREGGVRVCDLCQYRVDTGQITATQRRAAIAALEAEETA